MKILAPLVFGAWLCAAGPAAATERSPIHGHIEFLWEARDPSGDARAVALGLLMRPDIPHQVCWKSSAFPAAGATVRLDVRDADGTLVESLEHRRDGGGRVVECRDLVLDDVQAAPGIWTFILHFDGKRAAAERIEVAANLEQAEFYADPDRPYVVGRTNYPEGIDPADYSGHFLWTLSFNETGRVTDVRIREMSGIAERLRNAGLQAARLNRMPADPSRRQAPFRANQRYDFSSEE